MALFDIKSKLFQENIPKIKEILYKKDIEIVCFPTSKLKEMIAKNEHPIVKELGATIKKIFLEGNGFLIQKKMVVEWIEGRLDNRHSFILENSDLRIRQDKVSLFGDSK